MADATPPLNPTPTPAEASPAPSSSPTPPAAGAGEAAKPKEKRPVDAAKRERDAADAQLRRELKALGKEKDTAKLRVAAAKLKELRGGEAPAPSPGQADAPKAGETALATLEPGQQAGWPKPSEIAAQEGIMAHLWGEARSKLPERYARALEVRVEKGQVPTADGKLEEVSITVNPVVTLAKGTAPLAAQLLGKVNAMTPAAAAAVAVVPIFLPPFLEHMKELFFSSPAPAAVGQTAAPATPEAKA
jgi:hypothetical protein